MANILDYLVWRGDLEFNQSNFNEVDNLILARFSYFPFDNIIKQDETITIQQAWERFDDLGLDEKDMLQKEDFEMFSLLANTNRFSNLKITEFINKIDIEEEKQFSAITILIPDDTIYISFRGTDDTLVGWKEDLNMCFRDNVPSQFEAVKYTENIANKFEKSIRIGGHSKGGNLAVYAASFCDYKIKNRIISVYNNDGPGFHESIINNFEYKKIIPKVHTYVPQTSIFGRMLYHKEEYTVVKSTQMGVMQHDVYTWQVQANEFIYEKEVDKQSYFIDTTLKRWLEEVSKEQREKFINNIFEILEATEAKTVTQIRGNWMKNAKIIISTYKNMSEEEKKMMSKVIDELFIIIKDNIKGKVKVFDNN